MVKVTRKVQRGDGSEYETVVDVTEEAAKEMLKLEGAKLAGEEKAPKKDEEPKKAEADKKVDEKASDKAGPSKK